ncbi:hypothetical protein CLRAG_34070 [Clostridium ragsdalei P11]|uniref:Uncharacterized protein n=1 Tax=Clostridium ragsdalei P11 TaxID=1353534 RepID=A0A1A6AL04_9CLOT|nr:molybdopterin-dependent oxidoreductase [Clostridium ragsdalei]OBR90759.1 hypothetical protein CLRAG_34070 [Clostridium ragsdalei P11]
MEEIFINKRNRNILFVLIMALLLIIGILAYFNHSQMTLKDTSGEKIALKDGKKVIATLNKEIIVSMQAENFSAVIHAGGRPPEKHSYKGISMRKVLERQDKNILNGKKQVVLRGVDGYAVSFSVEEVKEKDNVYLVYKEDGKLLKNRKQGGKGPYMVVPRKDAFGQRWCKYLSEVDVE